MVKDRQTYAAAGVDIDEADRAKELIKKRARIAWRPEVITDIGYFGGLFELKGYQEPVLVSSTDGVGTKLKIASTLKKHDTIGIDLVNHCVNDIMTCGSDPLFFLDYIGTRTLDPGTLQDLIWGMAEACRQNSCALIGGETAEMPGFYTPGEYDLAGCIIGAVNLSIWQRPFGKMAIAFSAPPQ